jgi:hypothetical protein
MKTRPVYHLHRYDPAWGFATESRIVGTTAALEGTNASVPAKTFAGR